MGYTLRMSGEIHDWLAEVCRDDPIAARDMGAGLVALIGAGASLPPPLVVRLSAPPILDPIESLARAMEDRLARLQDLRRGSADAEALTEAIESQIIDLEALHGRIGGHAADAGTVAGQLAELRRLLSLAIHSRQRVEQAHLRMQAEVDALRVRTESLKASYTVAALEVAIGEALREPHAEATARLREATRGVERELRDGSLPDGLLELRAGPAGHVRARFLFAVEPADCVLLLAVLEGPDAQPARRQQAAAVSADVLALVRAGRDPEAAAFSYRDQQSFLEEFYPGDPEEVIAGAELLTGASALLAGTPARSLAEQRARLGLSQAEVAGRLGVSQERAAAIERAGPGAPDVCALAGYVDALGGRLQLVADFGTEQVTLSWQADNLPLPKALGHGDRRR